jgi:hypothetical protein
VVQLAHLFHPVVVPDPGLPTIPLTVDFPAGARATALGEFGLVPD